MKHISKHIKTSKKNLGKTNKQKTRARAAPSSRLQASHWIRCIPIVDQGSSLDPKPSKHRGCQGPQDEKTQENIAKTSKKYEKPWKIQGKIAFILKILVTRMKPDYQDDSSFSSWYPIKPACYDRFRLLFCLRASERPKRSLAQGFSLNGPCQRGRYTSCRFFVVKNALIVSKHIRPKRSLNSCLEHSKCASVRQGLI